MHTVMDSSELRAYLRKHGSDTIWEGQLYDIRTKSLGAGMYKVWYVPHDSQKQLR